MTIFNREDSRTVLPQLERQLNKTKEQISEVKEQIPTQTSQLENDTKYISLTDLVTEEYTIVNSESIASGGYINSSMPITKDGYFPLAVVGWTSGTRYFVTVELRLTDQTSGSATLDYFVYNARTSAQTSSVNAYILWVKEK